MRLRNWALAIGAGLAYPAGMAAPLIQLTNITLSFGGQNLLDGADLSVLPGERLCLVGRNGSGKSTLLKIAAGLAEADGGSVFRQPGARIRYLAQEPDMSRFNCVRDFVEASFEAGEPGHLAGHFLAALGLSGEENPRRLSGGEARRAALAAALAPMPDVLLLDEPTNHLDLAAIEWLEAELAGRNAALVLISHDRRFLSTLSQATVWLDRGTTRRLDRGFAGFEAWRDEVLAQEELEQHKLGRKIADEEHWLRYGVTARRKRNERRLRQLIGLRREKREHRGPAGAAVLAAAEAEKSGALVIEAQGLAKSLGGRPIVRDFAIRIGAGERLGVLGPNGAGKTTLVSLLTGALPPDAGMIRLGANVQRAGLEQKRDSLDPETGVADALTGGGSDQVNVGGKSRHVIGYLKDFLFRPEQARSPLKVLSGGERARLMLARVLATPSNLLVLDEPTNDLDLETLDVLEEMLGEYTGTLILISHDRDFVDRIVERVVVPEGEGRWRAFAGGYSDMLAARDKPSDAPLKAGADATKRSAARPEAPEKPGRRRLAFHEKHLLETLPGTMEKLKAVIGKLQTRLADPGFYARDAKAFGEASGLLGKAEAELAAQEEKWLELEILREEIEAEKI